MKSESRPRSFLGERLITQLEMTTSAVLSATGRFSISLTLRIIWHIFLQPGWSTPTGNFSVISKDIDHRSQSFGSVVDGSGADHLQNAGGVA